MFGLLVGFTALMALFAGRSGRYSAAAALLLIAVFIGADEPGAGIFLHRLMPAELAFSAMIIGVMMGLAKRSSRGRLR